MINRDKNILKARHKTSTHSLLFTTTSASISMASSLLSPSFSSFLRNKVRSMGPPFTFPSPTHQSHFPISRASKHFIFLHPFCAKVLTLPQLTLFSSFLCLSEGSVSLCFLFSAMLQSGSKENPLRCGGAAAPTFHYWISSVF